MLPGRRQAEGVKMFQINILIGNTHIYFIGLVSAPLSVCRVSSQYWNGGDMGVPGALWGVFGAVIFRPAGYCPPTFNGWKQALTIVVQ